MNREFLDHYDRELKLLHEQAREFAEDYPGVAERLGGLLDERMDPMIGGLLEGAAFLAARVQLKLKHEFPEFTNNLLEQLVPDYLAPTPSVILVRAQPPFEDAALRDGQPIARGSYLEAVYREQDRQVACRFRLTSKITLLPFEITSAEYFGSPAPLQALGVPVGADVLAGLKISLTHRSANRIEDEPGDAEAAERPDLWFDGCRVNELPFHFLGPEQDAIALYEQIFASAKGVYFRCLDSFGDPIVIPAGPELIEQLGFRDDEALFPKNDRIFAGFEWLREYFIFPRKFLGFRLTGLRQIFARLAARNIDIIISFKEINPRLQVAVTPRIFALYAAPAINLFEKTTDRVQVKSNQHEYHVVPDRSRYLDYEPHRLLSVVAHYRGGADAAPVRPLYSAEAEAGGHDRLSYAIRRMPRRRTARENKYGLSSDYIGTDIFIALVAPPGEERPVAELSVTALCSNRHLTEQLPVGQGGADFRLIDNTAIDLHCVAGPTRPREPIVAQLRSRGESAYAGKVTWRLINLLSLNHLGLVERGAGRNAQALRETVSMFADLSDSATERRIRGLRSVDSRPIVRRIRQAGGVGVARGVEVSVTIDEKAFEGNGIFLIGAILDRFYCEYAGFNHFTQTVILSVDRGEVMRWPVRAGLRRPL
ncbi:type VI secretion system baseplate subunit TssF [Methylocella tundrae]|uniref:Type VI secretion protein, VC_A0110 family n=1 Tax=Methylocella tundrae TaxID=227605 RepID=A0A4U8Z2N3_METTU|nr:type VI secretion system baseplate subunit TssF [Methylocella tundrae]WPP03493.1 type VI secretion system baseplate subunit TssF [Methylocella tundrae]VFU09588.1 Type VI secretion protein, VC_A0110 family [Methylocella tundrae]